MVDESFEFEFEADGRGDIRDKVEDLRRFASTHHLACTGTIHPTTRTVSVKLEPTAVPPPAVRVRQLLKHAGRTLGLRCVASPTPQGVTNDR